MKNTFRIAVIPLMAIVAFANANATTMCVESDMVAIVLDPDIAGTGYTNTSGEWTATFPYGTVSGISTCNSTSGSYGVARPNANFEQGTTGVYCWCRMLRPARSAWVYRYARSSASDCASRCAGVCGYYVRPAPTSAGACSGRPAIDFRIPPRNARRGIRQSAGGAGSHATCRVGRRGGRSMPPRFF